MPRISFSLNSKSIDTALKQLKSYQTKVHNAGENLTSELVDRGVEIAKNEAMYMNAYDSGELVGGIIGKKNGEHGSVQATAPHSAYVEFGTGVRGAQSPHPEPGLAGWKYDVNEHGEEGWWYWKNGEWHWTAGMRSRPYMYNTAKQLKQLVEPLAKEVLK